MATKQTNVRLSEEGRNILADLKSKYGSEAKVIDAALELINAPTPTVEETKGEPQDSVEVNIYSVLSLETRERIQKLISEHGYKSEQSVLDSAVETLYTIVTKTPEPPKSVRAWKGPMLKPSERRGGR